MTQIRVDSARHAETRSNSRLHSRIRRVKILLQFALNSNFKKKTNQPNQYLLLRMCIRRRENPFQTQNRSLFYSLSSLQLRSQVLIFLSSSVQVVSKFTQCRRWKNKFLLFTIFTTKPSSCRCISSKTLLELDMKERKRLDFLIFNPYFNFSILILIQNFLSS